ncbi:MAG TPA: hypothetical protein RMH99_18405 [Sandaracinaceae bacterium LLY-WYZ-13_1]|nr:hypothetical protein [Sandaracinaceae bacterium LLY-WYZ-13_1]
MRRVLTAIGALALAACAAPLEEPERFTDPQGCDVDVQARILAPRCASGVCHAGDTAAAGLDLSVDELALHLFDVEASGCEGRMLLDAEAPDESYLLERLGDDPRCDGESVAPMPADGPPLTRAERACVRGWVRATAARLNGSTP